MFLWKSSYVAMSSLCCSRCGVPRMPSVEGPPFVQTTVPAVTSCRHTRALIDTHTHVSATTELGCIKKCANTPLRHRALVGGVIPAIAMDEPVTSVHAHWALLTPPCELRWALLARLCSDSALMLFATHEALTRAGKHLASLTHEPSLNSMVSLPTHVGQVGPTRHPTGMIEASVRIDDTRH